MDHIGVKFGHKSSPVGAKNIHHRFCHKTYVLQNVRMQYFTALLYPVL